MTGFSQVFSGHVTEAAGSTSDDDDLRLVDGFWSTWIWAGKVLIEDDWAK